MLFRLPFLEGVQRGKLSLAFRRWHRPRVKAGTKLRTEIGVVEVVRIEPTMEIEITGRDAELAGYADKQELLQALREYPAGQLFRIQLRYAGADPRIELRNTDALSVEEFEKIRQTLQGYERSGPWTRQVLELISEHEALVARKLAAQLKLETAVFKRRVRQLKELGLTESLEIGYRLSSRGQAYMRMLSKRD